MDIVSIILSVGALAVSFVALRDARKALRLDHRPLVRVVALFGTQVGVFGQGGSVDQGLRRTLELGAVLLKNVGRGPALTVMAFDPGRSALLGEVPLVEPLGDGADEASRIGRVQISLQQRMEIGSDYELYYQDTLGEWHLTRFRPKPGKIECTFVGAVKSVPREVEPLGTVLKP